jgi:hypothetical protein
MHGWKGKKDTVKYLPRPRNKRLIASNEPPKHNAVGNAFLQSYKRQTHG